MSIKQNGGVFGRNPTFNDVTIEGDLIINGEVFTGLDFQGSWNASTNSPALASSTGTNGEFYIVSVAGTTDLNGITNWGIGDWAIFNGTVWQRVEGGADGNFNNLTANSLTATTADINGGTIDGTIIGGASAVAGTFTSVTASTGIYLGGAGAPNLLDDYEEGTWTPTYTGSSTSPTGITQFVDARYTVVGRAVHCVLHTYMSAFTGGSGNVQVNLPFTGNSATKQSGAFGRTTDWGTTKAPRAFFIEASGTFLTLLASESADARDNINDVVQYADMTTYDEIYICFTYFLGT